MTATPVPQWLVEREAALLAPYAMQSADSAGRRHAESAHTYRGPYQRDRDRIIHSAAFRRLAHKMQVFTGDLGDYHRTRLTHTLEVASIARTLARALRLNEDLVEALALAHDLGHPPFGHAGEETLDECVAGYGGFNHNRHALRLVEELEIRYQEFPGLNLTREVLEGQGFRGEKECSVSARLLEIQIVDAADSIAYDSHDVDDALELELLELADLGGVTIWRDARRRVEKRWANLDDVRLRLAVVHELIDLQVSDVLLQAKSWVDALKSVEDVVNSPSRIGFSNDIEQQKAELEQFLFDAVYRHPKLLAMREKAQSALAEMFVAFVREPERLPSGFRNRLVSEGVERTVTDYIAGMTDRFAMQTHERGGCGGDQ